MSIVVNALLLISLVFFIAGFACTVVSGTAKLLKRILIVLSILFGVLSVAGFIVTKGILIYLYFQILTLYLLFVAVMVIGSALGALAHKFRMDQNAYKGVSADNKSDYILASEFAEANKLDEEKVIARIKSGFYQGGCFEGHWYIHESEVTT